MQAALSTPHRAPHTTEGGSADTPELDAWVGFKPNTPVEKGIGRFVVWYRNHYGV